MPPKKSQKTSPEKRKLSKKEEDPKPAKKHVKETQKESRVTRRAAALKEELESEITGKAKSKKKEEVSKKKEKEEVTKSKKQKITPEQQQDEEEIKDTKSKSKSKKETKKDSKSAKTEDKTASPEVKPQADKKSEKTKKASTEKETAPQTKQESKSPELTKIILKGSIPVDPLFARASLYKVFTQGETIYSSTLNQSNISANNNKFYIIQLLQGDSSPKDLIVFTRWGRVGVPGQQAAQPFSNIEAAKKEYNKKLHEKTRKSYQLVEMNYEQEEEKKPCEQEPQEMVNSKLQPEVQDLVRLMFDTKMMAAQMKQIGYDAKKMPLGKLAKTSILKGYQVLKALMEELKGAAKRETIQNLSSEFYSAIPHDFGFRHMNNFVLDNQRKVKEKLQMLQSLEDIQICTKLLDAGQNNENPLDSHYQQLGVTITPLDPKSSTYQLLLKYVRNTHAPTHTAYRLQVEQIYEVAKEAEQKRFRKDIHNRQLLWHGSRLTNFVGILSQGLRIAPPEAPVTGYMFGKGVYFADMVTKSSNYCFANRENSTALMLLCEVALGEVNEKFYADYYANLLPEGKHSTKGCGKTAPSSGQMLDDVLVPCGQAASTGIQNSALLYNEFIVYDVAQIQSRYLFKMKFVFT